jgi:hypothetical protein
MTAIVGLDLFRKHFGNYQHNYIMIGGTACALAMDQFGFEFRVTKDMDVVLTLEAIDESFTKALWEFIKAGQYKTYQQSNDKDVFYRFHSPHNDNYPFMIELFARNPGMDLAAGSHLTPITWEKINDEEAKSLSAILMDDDYYQFIHDGRIVLNEISTINASHLIPLKGLAWIENVKRKNSGQTVDSKIIRKHRNDLIRLSQLLSPSLSIKLNGRIRADADEFLSVLSKEDIEPKQLGVSRSLKDIVSDLRKIYLEPLTSENDDVFDSKSKLKN